MYRQHFNSSVAFPWCVLREGIFRGNDRLCIQAHQEHRTPTFSNVTEDFGCTSNPWA